MKQIFLITLTLLTLSSCSRQLSPYTTSLHDDLSLNETALQNVQFYVSKDIILTRQLGESETSIKEGRIKMVDGRRVEEIFIPAGTPGVLIRQPGTDKFAISFESKGDEFLMFKGNRGQGGSFSLVAKDWENRIGKVLYGGKEFYTSPSSAGAILLVDVRKLNKTEIKSRRVDGRKIGG